MKRDLLIVSLAVFVITGCVLPGDSGAVENYIELTLVSWNVQNLFNAVDDGTEYSEFDPENGDWTEALFSMRLDNAGKVIREAFSDTPDILLLQEIENSDTLNQLKERTLMGLGYRYSACSRGGDRAVQVAVLSRIPISHIIELNTGDWEGRSLRPIQEIHFQLSEEEELVVFNNHWKSKSQGVIETEPARVRAAGILKTRISVLKEENPETLIVITGDLNCDIDTGDYQRALGLPEEKSVLTLVDRNEGLQDGLFFDPWLQEEYSGSYYFDETWERPDHILISPGLLDGRGWEWDSFYVGQADFLLNRDGSPQRWMSWTKSGYSDHLPLAVTLKKNGE